MQATTAAPPLHAAIVHSTAFQEQPQGYEMGMITNDVKKAYSERLPLSTILNYFGNGHCVLAADVDTDENNTMQFVSASFFAIDVDDDHEETDIKEIVSMLKGKLAGIFHTFSHGIKGNRYRLVFQLDQRITNEREMRGIIEIMVDELAAMGIPVDRQAIPPKQVIRGGKAAQLIDEQAMINAGQYKDKARQKAQSKQNALFDPNSRNHKPLPFDELKRMCEAIGHIPTNAGRGQEWNQCVYAIKHYVEMKMIADEEGRQLFDIISGGEATEKQWNAIKPRGETTIGTLIHKAKEQGFKPSSRTFQASISYGQTYTADRLEVKGYLQPKDIKPLIEEGGSILLDSPTGSAKTTSVIDAFQEIASKQKHFYVFACPTVALTDQVANDHSLRSVKGQTEKVMANAMRDARQGKRVFVSTYDKVPALIEHLRRVYPELTFTLAIDEYHKLVSDYDYRYQAISDLKAVQGQAENVLALSGTPEDIDKNEFDRVVKVNTGRNGSPCNEFGVYTFEYRKNALTELTELLKVRVQHHGWRVIVYMQSKANIDRVKQALRKAGIKTHVIDASKKSNNEYKNIVENGKISDDIQVLLTTNVIADGVSIYNEYQDGDQPVIDLNWEVIAVADGEHSPLFNISALKQMSNRLRKPYRRFSVFTLEARAKEDDLFNIEGAYHHRDSIARRITDELNSHPLFDRKLFAQSHIEQNYGITEDCLNNCLTYDKAWNRYNAALDQEMYYAKYRNAFLKATERILNLNRIGTLNISKAVRDNNLETALTEQSIAETDEILQLSEDEKKENILSAFTPKVYHAFRHEDEQIMNEFKRQVTATHYACLKALAPYVSFETCQSVVIQVKRKADTHAFFQMLMSRVETDFHSQIHRPSKTREAIQELLKLDTFCLNDEFKEEIQEIAKRIGVTKKDVEGVLKMMNVENKRTNQGRMKRVDGVQSVDDMAQEFGLSHEQVIEGLINMAKSKGELYEKATRAELRKEGFTA